MTAPTKVMAKLLLLDMIKLGKDPELSETAINETLDRATIVQLAETRTICDGRIEITPFYADMCLERSCSILCIYRLDRVSSILEITILHLIDILLQLTCPLEPALDDLL